MWGEQTRAVAAVGDDVDSADAVFARKLRKFDDTDARFRTLADRLDAYREALSAVAEAGVMLADALHVFFGDSVSSSALTQASANSHNSHPELSLQQQQHQQQQGFVQKSQTAGNVVQPSHQSRSNGVVGEPPVVSFGALSNNGGNIRDAAVSGSSSLAAGASHAAGSPASTSNLFPNSNGAVTHSAVAHGAVVGSSSNGGTVAGINGANNPYSSVSSSVNVIASSATAAGAVAAASSLTTPNAHAADLSLPSALATSHNAKSVSATTGALPVGANSRGHISAAFRASLQSIRNQWVDHFLKRFDDDVAKPIKDCLNQFPEVRSYIKERSAAQLELQKRQKKLRDTGTRVRDKQRKWRECSERYKMFDNMVVQRFSYIDRTQPNFVMPSVRALVSLLEDFTRYSASALREVSVIAAAVSPTITRDFTPPPRQDVASSTLSPNGIDDEGWDDAFDFDDDRNNAFSGADRATSTSADSRSRSAGPAPRPTLEDPRRAVSGPPLTTSADLRSTALPRRNPSPPGSAPPGLSSDTVLDSNGDASFVSGRTSALTAKALHNIGAAGHHKASASVPVLPSEGSKSITGDQESRSDRRHVLMRLYAIYAYTPLETNELEMRAGDIIEVYEKHGSGWWFGRTNHVNGYFPHSYTRALTEQEEVDYLCEKSRRRRERRKGHRRRDSHDSRRSGLSASQASYGTSVQGGSSSGTRLAAAP